MRTDILVVLVSITLGYCIINLIDQPDDDNLYARSINHAYMQ